MHQVGKKKRLSLLPHNVGKTDDHLRHDFHCATGATGEFPFDYLRAVEWDKLINPERWYYQTPEYGR